MINLNYFKFRHVYIIFFLLFIQNVFASTCVDIIPSGNRTTHLTSSEVTWNISGDSTDNSVDAILNSVTVTGQANPFTDIVMPDSVGYSFTTPSATSQFVKHNGVNQANIMDGNATFNPALLSANIDRNLRHYLSIDGNIQSTDYVDFFYDTPFRAAENRYVMVSERNGNNSMTINALDANGNIIGSPAEVIGLDINVNVTNINTNIQTDSNQSIYFTIYPLTALVSAGQDIHGIRLTQSNASGGDGGDGKVFIMYDPLSQTCVTANNDTLSIAAGGSTDTVFMDNGNGVDNANGASASDANIANNISITNDGGLTGISINTDGTLNIPAGATVGNYNVNYSICLELNSSLCDTAIASIEVLASTAFTCDDTFYFSNQNGSSEVVFQRINRDVLPYQNVTIGTPSSTYYNAMGYNGLDNYIYAVSDNNLIQIDKDGNLSNLGVIGGGYPSSQFYSGEFDRNGNYYVYDGSSKLHVIDVANKIQTSVIDLNETITFWDMAIDQTGNYFYAMSTEANSPWKNKGLIKIEIATGNVTHIGTETHADKGGKGSIYLAFSDASGKIYMQDATNGIFEVDVVTGELTLLSSSSDLGTHNDGTVCPNSTITIIPDTDGDNVRDDVDLDDDNDGILDSVECRETSNGFAEDLIQSAFHATFLRTAAGYSVSGENGQPNGVDDQLAFTDVSPANGYTYTGNLLRAAVGSRGSLNHQFAILSTAGLYVWGVEGIIIPDDVTTSTSFQAISMPATVSPSDVKNIYATTDALMLLTYSGDIWTLAKNNRFYGDGSSVADSNWHQSNLTNVNKLRVSWGNVFALTTTGDLYTYGRELSVGDGTAMTNSLTPLLMTPPAGVTIAQMATLTSDLGATYYILGTDGKIYALGANDFGQLGLGTVTNSQSWQTVRNASNTGDLTNVVFISATDQQKGYVSVSAIVDSGQVYSWGLNSADMIGTSSDPTLLPEIPAGASGMNTLYVENGGHITPLINDAGNYCNVGHNQGGGFGDGTTTSRASYECFPITVDLTASTCDLDGDGLDNNIDPDSDNDGCYDALEGAGLFTASNLDANNVLSGSVDANGVPTIASGGQEATVALVDNNDTTACATNVPPIATDLNRTIDTTETTTFDLLSLVSDSDAGDNLSITSINGQLLTGSEQNITVPNGTVQVATDGNVTFVPDNGYTGTSSFAYEATDGTETVTANVNITITTDTDGDGVIDAIDLDDDNDGILDSVEKGCTSESLVAGWNSNTWPTEYSQNGWTADYLINYSALGYDPSILASTPPDFSYGGGLTAVSFGSVWKLTGIGEANLAEAMANDNYAEYQFTTVNTLRPKTIVDKIHTNDMAVAGDNSYKIAVLLSKDDFTSYETLVMDSNGVVPVGDPANHYHNVANSSELLANTTYKIRVYFYGASSNATEVHYDDLNFGVCSPQDTDNDGVPNYLDLDSDNDGIPDNIEAQTTSGYTPTSGNVDANGTWSAIYGVNGLTVVDTDEDNVSDYLDTDSDDDNITDCLENNDAISTCPITNGMVGTNGLASWAENVDDYSDVNGLAHDGVEFKLDDTDNDTLADGSDANATSKDLDYRDYIVIIDALDDNGSVSGISGGVVTDVTVNDTLNGVLVTDSDLNITLTGDTDLSTTPSVDTNGELSVVANTPAGIYYVEYEICEGLNPSNCDEANVSVTVTSAIMTGMDDSNASVPNSGGEAISNVTSNDTLNTMPFVLGTDANITNVTDNTPYLEINMTTGVATVPNNTPANTYIEEYTVCENLNPTNCVTQEVSVTVEAGTILANDDSNSSVNGATGGTAIADITSNDRLDGNAVTLGVDVTISNVSDNTPLEINVTTGAVVVPAGTAVGNYRESYTLCEVLNPSNCSDANVTIGVGAALIDAVDDSFIGSINGFVGGVVGDVTGNDGLNGTSVNDNEINIRLTGDNNLSSTPSIDGNGTLSIPAGVSAGEYYVEYEICEVLNPSNCDEANATVSVTEAPMSGMDDSNASVPSSGGEVIPNVTSNDTLNGLPFVLGDDANITSVTGSTPYVEINATTGAVSVPANTPAGTYTEQYTVCENLNPTNCVTQEVSVTVESGSIIANDDSNNSVNGALGGVAIANVSVNDSLNANSVTLGSDVNITSVSNNTPLVIDLATGSVSVPAGTVAGSYTETYTLCEVLNPSNCNEANVTVIVEASTIDAIDDSESVSGIVGGVIGDVTLNDRFNEVFVVDSDINITLTGDTNLSTTLSIDSAGVLSSTGTSPSGTYYVEYKICEVLNPSNCDEANVTVTVTSATMNGMDDYNNSVPSTGGEAIENITLNDTLNGMPFILGEDANITTITSNTPYIEINITTGMVTVTSNSPAGTYTEEYTVCENLNPTNCVTQEVSVTVEAGSIVANEDNNDSVNGTLGGTAIVDITSNDTLDANAVTLGSDVNITTVTNTTPLVVDLATGSVSVPAGTVAGSYTETYTLCEVLNPSNCSTSTIVVEVLRDSDRDGILDQDDLDDDNDGILDTVEEQGTPDLDTDGDGVPDRLDLDSDNDGLLDLLESGQDPAVVDTDGNGVLDSTTDSDKDGVMETADADDNNPTSLGTVSPIDTDGDGIRDFQDIDSDNDGMTDLTEAGIDPSNDSDTDGRVDGPVDENGIPTTTTPVQTPPNTDGDTVPDYRDLDSDNDGLTDVEEAGLPDSDGDGLDDTPNESFANPLSIPDEDTDGTLDPLEPNNPNLPVEIDGDGDGIIDNTTDTDNDGIPNITDGRPENFATIPELDSDNDGIADVYDIDDDNDGITDEVEEQGTPDLDTDGDGVPDRLDLDADNDGILDLVESGQDPAVVDTNNDGILDSTTDVDNDGLMESADADDTNPESEGTVTPIDTDGDGKRDFQDIDSDNDGLSDMVEAGIPAQNDEDNDGRIDHPVDTQGVPTVITPASHPVDTDGDGVPDYRDLDSDNDGLNDVDEVGGLDEDRDGIVDVEDSLVDGSAIPDMDGDNIPDVLEPNNNTLPVTIDENGDGVIDDSTDTDGDGIPDITDEKDTIFGTGVAKDSDGDGISDAHDIDDDNDGIPDTVEAKGDVNRDTDGDGVIDSLDLDSDNDGMLDIIEALGTDSNNDGRVDEASDTDQDGLANVVDASATTANNPLDENAGRLVTLLLIPDTDKDGKDDFQDVDSDNDGLSDLVEAGISVNNDGDNDGRVDGGVDTNGIPTTITPVQEPLDSDKDTLPDYRELDSDNDGKKDIVEAGYEDSDNDGLVDTAEELLDATDLPDIDTDNTPDYREYNTQLIADVVSDVEPGESVIINVLQNDDVSGLDPESLQITGTQSPDESLIILGEGQWVVNNEQAILFTPELNFEGDPTSITYSLENSNGERLETAEVTVHYLPVARADIKTTDLSEPVTVEVLANDSGDLDNTSVLIDMPDGFTEKHPNAVLSEDAKNLQVPGEGTWSVNSDGTITYRAEVDTPIVNPTPVGYRVFDMQGNEIDTEATIVLNQTIVADATIDANNTEVCDPYEEKAVDSVNYTGLLVLILLVSALGLLLARKD